MTYCLLSSLLCISSCIEPPLRLPAQEVMIDVPMVQTQMEVVWNVSADWKTEWYYGWDQTDIEYWGELDYPKPQSFEVRRYFLGENPGQPHKDLDPFTIQGNHFKRTFEFGYYDMLMWSNIDSPDHSQALVIDESDSDNVSASTSVTRSISITKAQEAKPTALFNQPEVFYSTYPRDIYISRNFDDYDYYDTAGNVWVKKINCTLDPRVYIYLVQIILVNNDGRVVGVNGDCAISAFASSTNVNTGHTGNDPCMVWFNTRFKKGLQYKDLKADIAGGKLTTFGLCDMDGVSQDGGHQYTGSRTDLNNYLFFELKMAHGSIKNYQVDVTKQCREYSRGGVITVVIDCGNLEDPKEDGGHSIFNPIVEDYDEISYDIPV